MAYNIIKFNNIINLDSIINTNNINKPKNKRQFLCKRNQARGKE